ncbi:MAG: DNA mismatch repair protein MutS [Ruminococcaceae bacterium]|nr:DNA mismatch repair protein MutS [Oscillospiraceae bacterium]
MALTAMMQQYMEIKNQYKDYILFYRLGDFYEMFFDDAKTVSAELELTLTGRDCGEAERAPMCGVPYHSCEPYIGRLIEKGYKVAICEQMEDPATAKGLVKREVVRIITPGTLTENGLLRDNQNNYLAMIYCDGDSAGVCFADLSTAYICATAITDTELIPALENELSTYAPSEVIMNVPDAALPGLHAFYTERVRGRFEDNRPEFFQAIDAAARAQELLEIGAESPHPAAMIAAGAAMLYLEHTQKREIPFMNPLHIYKTAQFLEMDIATRRNLELCETMLAKERRGSLLWVLDKTCTAMGARLLRNYIEHPLTNIPRIQRRQGAVGELCTDFMLRGELHALLEGTLDIERLITKLSVGTAGGRDLRAISQSIRSLPEIIALLQERAHSEELRSIAEMMDPLTDIRESIDMAIVDEPPFPIREGGIIRDGYSRDVDELRSIMNDGKGWIERVEAQEREKTGIKNLRISYNRVFGYYIEVTRSFLDQVPAHYIRKQTLTNAERFITEELKNMESTILGAADRLQSLEYELFIRLRDAIAECSERIRRSAAAIAKLDVYASLAEVAAQHNYVCPEVDFSDILDIRDGRHPVVEQFVRDSYFVPNDTMLDCTANRLMLITGPNMAGKSTYMRQNALIILMAQIGSFVPAREARIGIVDRLFTRVGASDDLASGQSTFMLEMKEVAFILRHATRRSFIIYDEIGRGTSTYDGMSIARAVAEYTAGRKLGAKTMFATHYHELTSLENELDGVVNYNVAAKKRGGDVTFLRKIVRGPTDDSYGIEVAQLAGVPTEIIRRAKEILKSLEASRPKTSEKPDVPTAELTLEERNITFADTAADEIKNELKKLDINTLTPIEAMNLLFEWKKRLE